VHELGASFKEVFERPVSSGRLLFQHRWACRSPRTSDV